MDRPGLVRALVVVDAAYRQGPQGLQVQQELARSVRAGDFAGGMVQAMTEVMLPAALRGAAGPIPAAGGTIVASDADEPARVG